MPTYVGIMGWPVSHSRSPAMHNAAFQALGMDWRYLFLPVAPDDVEEAVCGLRALRFAGANVTVPHKRAVIPALDRVTVEARAIGAVNTIVNRDGVLEGHNTDAIGFLRALREAGFEPRGCRAVVLGAGGAARAIVYTLLAAKATVTVVNRTLSRARHLAEELGALFRVHIPTLPLSAGPALQTALAKADLLVNATSVGMAPNVDASPLPDGVTIPPTLTLYETIYTPRETALMGQAHRAGARVIGGLGMLLHQGAVAFELWTATSPPLEVMRRAIEAEL
ncbi:MAG: shikimate dehydrogenase [Ardenticatenia bacterium]|nr:shikimate dehydrogenase [Ardenticatenia bacterium]